MPARHEWIKSMEQISDDAYDVHFRHFDPDLYDPREWARKAKAAGMKYAVLTTKHHEGFCLFDSKYTDYKSTNTPCGRDLVKEFVEAFRAEGLKIGFYYSLLDWRHPDYTIDVCHPLRNAPDREAQNEKRDMRRYAEYMRAQITELLTNYGKIDVLWLDYSFEGKGKDEWESEKLIATARALQPDILINNRSGIEQDLWTPEQEQPREWVRDDAGNLVTWELCQTFSGSWGYHRDENTWLNAEQLVRMLVGCVAEGGNLLLNVGPTARGYFDKRVDARLAAIGEWMTYHGESVYGCTKSRFDSPGDIRYTEPEGRNDLLYAHLFAYPYKQLFLPGLQGKVEYACFLHDGSELLMTESESGVTFDLPRVKPDVLVPVVKLYLKTK